MDYADDYTGNLSHFVSDQTDQSQYPGSYESGLLKNRAGEGHVRVCRSVYTCAEKFIDPGDHLSGTTDCIDFDRRICGGECIQCTWSGTLFCKFHQQP